MSNNILSSDQEKIVRSFASLHDIKVVRQGLGWDIGNSLNLVWVNFGCKCSIEFQRLEESPTTYLISICYSPNYTVDRYYVLKSFDEYKSVLGNEDLGRLVEKSRLWTNSTADMLANEPDLHSRIVNELDSDNESLIKIALNSLEAIGVYDDVPKIIQIAQGSPSDIYGCAIRALGGIGSEKAVDYLISEAMKSGNRDRGYSIRALGKSNSDTARDFLLTLEHDSDVWTVIKALEALSAFDGPSIEPFVRRALLSSDLKLVRQAIDTVREARITTLNSVLHKLLQTVPFDLKTGIAQALGFVGDETSVPVLQRKCRELLNPFRSYYKKALDDVNTRLTKNGSK